MALKDGHKHNFAEIQRAAENGDLGLLECTCKKTGRVIAVVVAISHDADGINIVPLAKMFDGNPYDQVAPPGPDVEVCGNNEKLN